VRRLAVALVVAADLAAVGGIVAWNGTRTAGSVTPPPTARPAPTAAVSAWDALDVQARCDGAVALVSRPNPWPMRCRWRVPGDFNQGSSFPPPAGDPPFDQPRIEIYVDPAQTRDVLARVIAHEMGHMRHTRAPTFVPEWLAARGLAPDTPWPVWTEDYAEVFAALFAPPGDRWRAPTPRPGPEALAGLRARFFSAP